MAKTHCTIKRRVHNNNIVLVAKITITRSKVEIQKESRIKTWTPMGTKITIMTLIWRRSILVLLANRFMAIPIHFWHLFILRAL